MSELAPAENAPARNKITKKTRLKKPDKKFLKYLLKILDDEKAENVTTIELDGKSEMADYMIIASGRSSRQVISLSQNISDKIKSKYNIISRIEGKEHGDWVLIDTGDVVVHIFKPEIREFYQLEQMWNSPQSERS
ncbi:MAG: ribosome silencing factor [Rhodobacteraceae bacterium]|nr:MAG: ribosome silencing factor [Paracoccaceae bacterium]